MSPVLTRQPWLSRRTNSYWQRRAYCVALVWLAFGCLLSRKCPYEFALLGDTVRRCSKSGRSKIATKVAGDFTGGMAREWLIANGYEVETEKSQGGSGWASFQIVKTAQRDLFIKTSNRGADEMFKGEALGLRALRAAGAVKVPEVLHYGDGAKGGSFIIMEKLDLRGKADMREFGKAMAMMHLAVPMHAEAREGKFGFEVDNTIGGTPQKNPWTEDWIDFFREHRIGFQVARAERGWELRDTWKTVLDKTDGLKTLFTDVEVKPSVLHGDLWSGNYDATPQDVAIYDPATYYGHHEAEWGMSWCANFNSEFWSGYRELISEAPLFKKRRKLYQAYHIINHHNLFGGMYLEDAIDLLEQLV